jgi:hypothetical protein
MKDREGRSREIQDGRFKGDIWKSMCDTETTGERKEIWDGKLKRDIGKFVKETGRT